jgi:RNA polymerase sigma-70 factor, ECF subfamily
VFAQPPACVVKHLVKGVPVRAEPFREHVDRHPFEHHRDEDLPLPRRERRPDSVADDCEEVSVLGLVVRAGPHVREALPALRLERHLAVTPGAPPHLHRRLEQRELVRPGAEAALAAEVVQAPENRDGGVIGGVLRELVELDCGELGEGVAPPEDLETGRSEKEPVQPRDGLLMASAVRMQVEVPLLETGGCCKRAHVGISVRRGQGLTFYRRGGALRGKRGRPLGQLAVLVGDPTGRMRRPADRHTAEADVDVRVMVLAFREVGEPVDELDRVTERGELELPHERVVLLLPIRHCAKYSLCGTHKPVSAVQDFGGVREPSDRELVRKARRGDREAAAALFRRYWRDAWRAAFAITGRRSLADDVAADGFERAFAALGRFDDRRPFGPWLHRIVANRALDLLRAERRLSDEELPETPDLAPLHGTGDRGLLSAVAELSLERRVVVVLRYGVGMTPKQIAAALDLPVGTVNSRLARALEQLRDSLEVEHVE